MPWDMVNLSSHTKPTVKPRKSGQRARKKTWGMRKNLRKPKDASTKHSAASARPKRKGSHWDLVPEDRKYQDVMGIPSVALAKYTTYGGQILGRRLGWLFGSEETDF
jgi:hypothetical protein